MSAATDLPNGRAAVFQDNSYHGEDAYVIRDLRPGMTLDAVLDGATGRGGADASRYAAELLRTSDVDSVEALTALLQLANQRLFQRGRGRFFLSTASAALQIGRVLHVVSVGDSPVFLVRGREVFPLTAMGSAPIFVGVGNALGRREPLVYKQDHIELQAGDRIVLATDGLSENVAPEELAALIDTAPAPEQAVAALQEMMCDKQRRDRGRSDDPSGFRHDDATAIIRYIGLTPS